MCLELIGYQKKIKTARKDIVCYKILRKGTKYFTSPILLFKYEKGELYYEDSLDKVDKTRLRGTINWGLHSFISADNTWSLSLGEVIVKCIIPKGSKYYKGNVGYCSDHLKIGTDKDIVKVYKK